MGIFCSLIKFCLGEQFLEVFFFFNSFFFVQDVDVGRWVLQRKSYGLFGRD